MKKITLPEIIQHQQDKKEFTELKKRFYRDVQVMKGDRGEKGDPGEAIVGPPGPQGEKGDKPIAGIDYAIPKDGNPGKDGKNGEPGKDGKAGKDANEEKIIEVVTKKIPKAQDGKPGSPDTPNQIKEKLKELPIEGRWFDARHIKGLPLDVGGKRGMVIKGGGVIPLAYNLSSQLDGNTKVFTIPANSALISINSSSAPFSAWIPTTDYVISGASNITLTFTSNVDAPSALASGQSLVIIYLP